MYKKFSDIYSHPDHQQSNGYLQQFCQWYLKQVHPDTGIFNKAMAIHNSSINDILSSPSWHRYLQQGYLQQFHQWHLKQVHPNTGISNKAMAICNSSINDILSRSILTWVSPTRPWLSSIVLSMISLMMSFWRYTALCPDPKNALAWYIMLL